MSFITRLYFPSRARKKYFKVHVDGTRKILEASLQTKIAKVVFISTSAVYGVPRQVPITETTQPSPLGDYGLSKYLAEKVCAEFKTKGCDISILRPRALVGRGRLGIFSILYERIRRGKIIPILGSGKNLFQFLSGRDLASACYLASEKPCYQEDFNLGAEKFGTVEECLSFLIRHAKTKSRILPLPVWPAQAVLFLLDCLRLSPLVNWHYRTPHKPFYFDISKAKTLLGWQPIDSNQDMLCEGYDWYLKILQQGPLKTGTRHSFAVESDLF